MFISGVSGTTSASRVSAQDRDSVVAEYNRRNTMDSNEQIVAPRRPSVVKFEEEKVEEGVVLVEEEC